MGPRALLITLAAQTAVTPKCNTKSLKGREEGGSLFSKRPMEN